MINITGSMLYRLDLLNQESTRISYQTSTGKILNNGSDDSVVYARQLYIGDKVNVYDGIQKQIEKTASQNDVADSTVSQLKEAIDYLKNESLRALNSGMADADLKAVATNVKGIRNNIVDLMNANVEGEYVFSGSNTTIKPFEKSLTFDADGKINFDGDGILRKVAVDISLYRQRGVTAYDLIAYDSDTAVKGDSISFSSRERVVDERGLEWVPTSVIGASDSVIDQDGKSWVFVDSDGIKVTNGTAVKMVQKDGISYTGNEMKIFGYSGGNYTVQTSDQDNIVWNLTNNTDPSKAYSIKLSQIDIDRNLTDNPLDLTYDSTTQKYTSGKITTYGSVLSAKHNFFDDIQNMIEALNSADRENIQASLDQIGAAYDQANIGQSELGGRNKIFEIALEGVMSQLTHYNILYQEVSGADLTRLAVESKALEMTYTAIYSTISRMNQLSLVNYMK